MPLTPSFSLYNAVHNFHAETDRRAWHRHAWNTHAAQRDAHRHIDQGVGDAAQDAGLHDAAAALHDTLFRGIRADFCFAQGLLGFNQLPATHAQPGSAAQLQTHTPPADGRGARLKTALRASTLGMLVGCAGKLVVLTTALVIFAPLSLLRRSLDWLLQYARAGVPMPPAEGARVAQAERRLAMQRVVDECVDRAQGPIEAPPGRLCANALKPLSPAEGDARLHALMQHPKLDFLGESLDALAARGTLACVPALETLLDPAVLGRSLQHDVVALQVDDRPFSVPLSWLTGPQGPRWSLALQRGIVDGATAPSLQIRCGTVVPAGRYASGSPHESQAMALHLRVPVRIDIDLQLSLFGASPRTLVAVQDVWVTHEPDRPLWYPQRPGPLGGAPPRVPASASPARPSGSLTPEQPTPMEGSRSPSPALSPVSEKFPASVR